MSPGAAAIGSVAPTRNALLLVAALALLPYLLLPKNPLVGDALRSISDNPVVTSYPLVEVFRTDIWGAPLAGPLSTGSWRPLPVLTWALETRFLGDRAPIHHLGDMLLHAGCAVLLLWLLSAWLPGSRWAVPAAALFALHPLLSEAVASAVGRADLLAALGLLMALTLRAGQCAEGSTRRWSSWIVAALAGALLSKEYAVTFVPLFIAADLAFHWTGRTPAACQKERGRLWMLLALLLIGWLALRYSLIGRLGGSEHVLAGDHPLADQPFSVRLQTAFVLVATAARLIVVPLKLTHIYAAGTVPIAAGWSDPRLLLGAALLIGLCLLGLWRLRGARDPVPLLAALLFMLPLLPTLNLVGLSGVMFAERFLYLPTAAAIVLLCWALTTFAPRSSMPLILVPTVGLGIAAAIGTSSRVSDWGSLQRLAQSGVDAYPKSAQAWAELGFALASNGDPGGAIDPFQRSLAVESRRPQVWSALAMAQRDLAKKATEAWQNKQPAEDPQKLFAASAESWRRAMELSPGELAPLWAGLGEAEIGAGHFESAVRALSRVVELWPDDKDAKRFLGNALARLSTEQWAKGQRGEAAASASRALGLGAIGAEATFAAGVVLARSGRQQEAQGAFLSVTQQDDKLLQRHASRAAELSTSGRHADAAKLFQELLLVLPDDVGLLFNAGHELLLAGQPREAIPLLEAGLKQQPNFAPARAAIEAARRDLK